MPPRKSQREPQNRNRPAKGCKDARAPDQEQEQHKTTAKGEPTPGKPFFFLLARHKGNTGGYCLYDYNIV